MASLVTRMLPFVTLSFYFILFHSIKKEEVECSKKALWWTSMELDVSFDLDRCNQQLQCWLQHAFQSVDKDCCGLFKPSRPVELASALVFDLELTQTEFRIDGRSRRANSRDQCA